MDIRIPKCSKTNPNPCVLIPWTKTPFDIRVFMRSLSPEAKRIFKENGYLVMPPDPGNHLAWKYQVIEETLMRRHFLIVHPVAGAAEDEPRFLCEVCGKFRPADQSRTVKCGWSAVDAMDYLVCPRCIQLHALDLSRELGFYVRMVD